MKNLYIVKNITSAETNSAGVFKQDATNWKLIHTP